MPKTKEEKRKIIDDLKEKILNQKILIFVDFRGLKTKDLSLLREKLKEKEAIFKVVKKTLLKIALEELKIEISEKVKELEGELALIFGFGDEISIAKEVYKFSKENENLKILGAFFEGKLLKREKIIEMSQLPTKNEMLQRLLKSISSPLTNLIYVLEGNIKGLLYVLREIKQK